MITNERFEQLKKDKSTVYIYNGYGDKIHPFKLSGKEQIEHTKDGELQYDAIICYCDKCLSKHPSGHEIVDVECVYETKESAQWSRDFRNVKKVYSIDFPFWDEVNSFRGLYTNQFCAINNDELTIITFQVIAIGNRRKQRQVRIITHHDEFLFEKYLSKKTYIEACKLCKELFCKEKI